MSDVVGIHILGAGDLGVPPQEFEAAIARLVSVPLAERAELLLATRPEAHHQAPSLSTFMEYADPTPDEVWLVATDQRPVPHPGDTWRLGRVICEALNDRPLLYGRAVRADVVTVDAMSLDVIAQAVRAKLTSARPTQVVLNLGPGGNVVYVAAVLGSVEAGIVPTLVRSNRRPGDTGLNVDLKVSPRLDRWLARMSAYDVLAKHDPVNSQRWTELAAVHRLDWSAAPVSFSNGPAVPSELTRYRQAVELSLLERVGRGDRLGAFLLRPWMHATYAEAHDIHNASGTPHEELESLMQHERVPARWEEEYRADSMERVWETGRKADHGRFRDFEYLVADVRSVDRLSISEEVADLPSGYPRWSPLAGRGRLLVHTVGLRNLAPDGTSPMLEAVLGDSGPSTVHLRLVATDGTTETAEGVAALAQHRVASVEVLPLVPEEDADQARSIVVDALNGDERLLAIRACTLYVGPGTKSMNIGALLAVLAWSMENAAPMRLGALLERDGGARTEIEWARGSVMARLAHDQVLRSALLCAVEAVGLGLASQLCELGSANWDRVKDEISVLDDLAFAARPRGFAAAELWPARLNLLSFVIEVDPWRAVYAAAAIGEATRWTGRWRDRKRYKACYKLWQLRNDSPFGHKPMAKPPPAGRIRRLLADAASEHAEGAQPRELLVDRWRALRQRIESTAT